MNTYIGTKIVRAKPMTRAEYNQERGWMVPADENPGDEGYLVEYLDGGKPNHPGYTGYVSWSPKAQFDNAYILVGEVQASCLAPHEVRVLAEQAELTDRIKKLNAFVGSEKYRALDAEDRDLLSEQLYWMQGYSHVLAKRVARFVTAEPGDDFELPAKACDLSGESGCEACQ